MGLGNDHLPEFVGALGVIVVLVSIVGFSGACFLNMVCSSTPRPVRVTRSFGVQCKLFRCQMVVDSSV